MMQHTIRTLCTILLVVGLTTSMSTLSIAQEQEGPETSPAPQLQSTIKVLTEELRMILNANTVVGKPIELKGFTIIPLLCAGFGIGAGQGDMRMKNIMDMMGRMGGKSEKNDRGAGEGSSAGSGGGGGGGIAVTAVLVISDKGVEMLPVRRGALAGLAEAIAPIIIEGIKSRKAETTASTPKQ